MGEYLGGGFKDFLFSPLFGEDSHFDSYFSKGLVQPPTRYVFTFSRHRTCKSGFQRFLLLSWELRYPPTKAQTHSPEQPATLAGGDGACSLEMPCFCSLLRHRHSVAFLFRWARIEQCIQCIHGVPQVPKVPSGCDLRPFGPSGLAAEAPATPKTPNSTSATPRPNRRLNLGRFRSVEDGYITEHSWTQIVREAVNLGIQDVKFCLIDQIYRVTLPETNSSHLKISHPKRKGSSSNYQFSGASC